MFVYRLFMWASIALVTNAPLLAHAIENTSVTSLYTSYNPADPYGLNALFNTGSAYNALQINSPTWLNVDPVVVDLNGDGVSLSAYAQGSVYFDVDNDGFKEHTGWTSDGILVHDRNGNGTIDDITETLSEYYVDGVANDNYRYISLCA